MRSLLQRPSFNPILVKELRSRMRGGRPYAILTTFLLLMIGMGYAIGAAVTVVGIVGNTATYHLREEQPTGKMYLPQRGTARTEWTAAGPPSPPP